MRLRGEHRISIILLPDLNSVPMPRRLFPLAVLLALAACGRSHRPIQIGIAGTFSDSLTVSMRHAAELAAEEINATGGIGGRRLELVLRDDYGSVDSAVRVATELYRSDVVAVIGHSFSAPTLAAAPVYNGGAHPLVQISPSASSPDISNAGRYTFRVCPSDLAHGSVLARWARQHLGYERGAILYLNNGYGRGIRQTFSGEFTRLGGQVLSMDPYLGDTPEVDPYLDRIAARQQAQFILLAGYQPDATVAIRDARARGITVPFLGGDGLEQIYQLGPLAEGTYVTNAYFESIATPGNRQFLQRYHRRFPRGATPNQSAIGTWDALMLLREVIARTGTDRAAIRAGVAAVGSTQPAYQGLTRRIAFDQHGDLADQNVFIGMVRGGRVIPVSTQ